MTTKKPTTCPACRAKGTVRRIVYGEPTEPKNEAEARRRAATIVWA